nr:hypothetical protein [Planctomycetota bacterium]
MNIFTAHWELKVVAIVLAAALWIYTSGQVRSERSVDVQLRPNLVTGLGDTYQITSITPIEFRVTLSVPSSRSEELQPQVLTPRLEIRANALGSRSQTFPITSSTLGLTNDVRILRTEPESLREIVVKWDSIIEYDMPVEMPELINVPPGMTADVKLDRTIVRVRAANDVIDRRQKVRFQPIDLGVISDPKAMVGEEQRIILRKVSGLPYNVEQDLGATVVLKPLPASMVVPAVPVQVLMAREDIGRYRVELVPAVVNLTVHGPENLLKTLKPASDITAYVDLRGASDLNVARDLPVSILGPAWLTSDLVTVQPKLEAVPPDVPLPPESSRPEIAPPEPQA